MRRCEHEFVCWAMAEYGDAECPGPCDAYAPMVDVDALLKLADEIQMDGADSLDDEDWCKGLLYEYAHRIREALGVQDG